MNDEAQLCIEFFLNSIGWETDVRFIVDICKAQV